MSQMYIIRSATSWGENRSIIKKNAHHLTIAIIIIIIIIIIITIIIIIIIIVIVIVIVIMSMFENLQHHPAIIIAFNWYKHIHPTFGGSWYYQPKQCTTVGDIQQNHHLHCLIWSPKNRSHLMTPDILSTHPQCAELSGHYTVAPHQTSNWP